MMLPSKVAGACIGLLLSQFAYAVLVQEDAQTTVAHEVVQYAHDLAKKYLLDDTTEAEVRAGLADDEELRTAVEEHMVRDGKSEAPQKKLLERARAGKQKLNVDLDKAAVKKDNRATACFCALTAKKKTKVLPQLPLLKVVAQNLDGAKCEDSCFFMCQKPQFRWEPDATKALGAEAYTATKTKWGWLPFNLGGESHATMKVASCNNKGQCNCFHNNESRALLKDVNEMLDDFQEEKNGKKKQCGPVSVLRNVRVFENEKSCFTECNEEERCGDLSTKFYTSAVCVDEWKDHQ